MTDARTGEQPASTAPFAAPPPRRPRRLCPHRLRPRRPRRPRRLRRICQHPASSAQHPASILTASARAATVDPAHAPTLEFISSGMAAFDSGDVARRRLRCRARPNRRRRARAPAPARFERVARTPSPRASCATPLPSRRRASARRSRRSQVRTPAFPEIPGRRRPAPRRILGRTRRRTGARRRLRLRASRDTSPRSLSTSDTARPS